MILPLTAVENFATASARADLADARRAEATRECEAADRQREEARRALLAAVTPLLTVDRPVRAFLLPEGKVLVAYGDAELGGANIAVVPVENDGGLLSAPWGGPAVPLGNLPRSVIAVGRDLPAGLRAGQEYPVEEGWRDDGSVQVRAAGAIVRLPVDSWDFSPPWDSLADSCATLAIRPSALSQDSKGLIEAGLARREVSGARVRHVLTGDGETLARIQANRFAARRRAQEAPGGAPPPPAATPVEASSLYPASPERPARVRVTRVDPGRYLIVQGREYVPLRWGADGNPVVEGADGNPVLLADGSWEAAQ